MRLQTIPRYSLTLWIHKQHQHLLRPLSLPAERGSPEKKELVFDSLLKKALRSSMASVSSLRPYAQSCSRQRREGRHILK